MSGLEGLLAGRTLAGRYRIEELIGRGGFAAVYRARDERLGRTTAVKVITLAASDPEVHEQIQRRFEREARVAASLDHPNVVTVYDVGTDTELQMDFLVMELLHGEDLAHRLARPDPLPVAAAVRILRDAARGIGAGHAGGLIHRDVKPANIFLAENDREHRFRVCVLDFGIAQILHAEHSLTRLTSGAAPLSPRYASPEQLQESKELTPASDVYSLGLIGCELLMWRRPLTPEQVRGMSRGKQAEVPSLDVPGAPRELEATLRRALAWEPEERFPDARQMAEALDVVLTALRVSAEPEARRMAGAAPVAPPRAPRAVPVSAPPPATPVVPEPAAPVSAAPPVAPVVPEPAAPVSTTPPARPVVPEPAAPVSAAPPVAPVTAEPATALPAQPPTAPEPTPASATQPPLGAEPQSPAASTTQPPRAESVAHPEPVAHAAPAPNAARAEPARREARRRVSPALLGIPVLLVAGGVAVWAMRGDEPVERTATAPPRQVEAPPVQAPPVKPRVPDSLTWHSSLDEEAGTVPEPTPTEPAAEAPPASATTGGSTPPPAGAKAPASTPRVAEAPARTPERTSAATPAAGGTRSAAAYARDADRLFTRGSYPAAVAGFRRAVEAAPRNAYYRNQLGWALFQTGDMTGAERELREAVRLDPDRAIAYANLGEVYRVRGDTPRAITNYRRFLALNREPRRERIATEKLRSMGATP